MIITKTPFRISFFGGGTDYPEWFLTNAGAVLSTTIDKYCYITCRRLPPFFSHRHRVVYSAVETVASSEEIKHPAVRAALLWKKIEDGLEIHHDGDLPARSGLGSSSSFTVGLLNALYALEGKTVSKRQLAEDTIYLEQSVIGEAVGSQDQVAASFGGLNLIEFQRDTAFVVNPVIIDAEKREALSEHVMLFFTGISRIAATVAEKKIRSIKSRTVELQRMYEMVWEAQALLQGPDESLGKFGALLNESWKLKRSLSDGVSSEFIDSAVEVALGAGALGVKILGAGGGGFLMVFADPSRHAAIKSALGRLVFVPINLDNEGTRVVLYEPSGL